MIVKLCGLIIEIKSRYRYTFDLCRDYLYDGEEKPEFTTFATDEQIIDERKKTPEFSDDILESTCIYRNICTMILNYDGVLIHSAAISVDNKGYMFSANSGTGKTTHMNLWLEKFGERAFVINGDKPILRRIDGKFYVFGTPWCGKEGLNKNIGVPLEGIYILHRSKENEIKRAQNKDALIFLLTQTIQPPKAELKELMYDILDKLIKEVPVYQMGCNMEMEACEVAYNGMKN